MRFVILLFSSLLLVVSCLPVPEDNQEEVVIDLADEEIQKIYTLQNQQSLERLKPYLSHKKATYRYLAASAFASFQTEDVLPELSSLLFDKNDRVKTAAAYALGQIGSPEAVSSLLEAFDSDEKNINSELNATILEAVGKCGDQKMLDYMSTTSTYKIEDDQLLLGQARGIYRFALRGITSEKGTDRMAEIVINTAFPIEARVMAANYLFRARDINLTEYKFQLLEVLSSDSDPRVRMCLVRCLAQMDDPEVNTNLWTTLAQESDERVQSNLISGWRNSIQPILVDSLLPYVSSIDQGVSVNAISVIAAKAQRQHSPQLRELANTITDSQVRAEILRSALTSAPFSYRNTKKIITDQIMAGYESAATDYDKCFYLSALSGDPANYETILSLLENESPIVKSLSIAPLMNVISSPNFKNLYRTRRSQNKVKSDLVSYLVNRIDAGDLGEIAAAGEWLSAMSEEVKEVFTDSLTLATSIVQLNGPSEVEAKASLQNALSRLTTYTFADSGAPIAKDINWTTLANISDSPIAILVTTKGRITASLTPNLTPGTVANFIEQTDANYYDQKTIHRVVPNFVVQGGCPRGDGYGSPDFTIRSEVPQMYYDTSGYIGMASAGPHTESVQWFITHSPTPHLDGQYTIFGKVEEGMDVVNQLEIGDIIQDIRILKYN